MAFAGLVALAYLVLALLPATRPVFLDRRARGAGPGELAYQVLQLGENFFVRLSRQ